MPLYNILRREVSCYQEHIDNFHDPVLGCVPKKRHILPPEYKRYTKVVTTIISHPDCNTTQHPALPQFGAESLGGAVSGGDGAHGNNPNDIDDSSSDNSSVSLASLPQPERRSTRVAAAKVKETAVTNSRRSKRSKTNK